MAQIASRQQDLNHLTQTAEQIREISPQVQKAIAELTPQQWKEMIHTGLEGERLVVSIKRKRDLIETGEQEGPLPGKLDDPVYRVVRNRKVADWVIKGYWNLNLDATAQYIRPLFKLNNRIHSILTGTLFNS